MRAEDQLSLEERCRSCADAPRTLTMIEIQKIRADEGAEAAGLIMAQFEQHIFADYTEEGKTRVRQHVTAAYLLGDDMENFTLVAKLGQAIVGVAKVRSGNHLSMLFVAAPFQRRGYGGRLLTSAMAECKARNPAVTTITASGSRFALTFFLQRGFRAEGEEKHVNGMCFTPIRSTIAGK